VTPDEMTALADEVRAAHSALEVTGNKPSSSEWHAYFAIRKRWEERPSGREAAPGDLWGQQLPGEWPHGGRIRCRRCNAIAGLEGHPYGCPVTPYDFGEPGNALHRCYCGTTLVVAPEIFGDCCAGTPPVSVPGGCKWCGSSLCRVGEPDDQPELQFNVPERHPGMGDHWIHACCYDEYLIGRGLTESAASRSHQRAVPLGVVGT
jgi:hypothetical protein